MLVLLLPCWVTAAAVATAAGDDGDAATIALPVIVRRFVAFGEDGDLGDLGDLEEDLGDDDPGAVRLIAFATVSTPCTLHGWNMVSCPIRTGKYLPFLSMFSDTISIQSTYCCCCCCCCFVSLAVPLAVVSLSVLATAIRSNLPWTISFCSGPRISWYLSL